jgi:hypothetical protein
VRDDCGVGHRRGPAGHGDAEDGEEEIELPETGADPERGAQDDAEHNGGDENDAFGAEAIDEHACGREPEGAHEVKEREGEGDSGAAGVEALDERLEEDAEREDEERSAEEEPQGADQDDEPAVEDSWSRGHCNSGLPHDAEFFSQHERVERNIRGTGLKQ